VQGLFTYLSQKNKNDIDEQCSQKNAGFRHLGDEFT
jgi:hypothetical protein